MTLPHLALWFSEVPDGDAESPSLRGTSKRARESTDAPAKDTVVESLSERDVAELALVRQIGAGDERAFRRLYDHIYPSLWDFARSLTDSRDTADDLAQEAFTLLWQRAPAWEPRVHVRGFLFTTVRNLTRNARRHTRFADRTEAIHHTEIAQVAMAAIPGTPEERIQHRELIAAVGRAVAALPEPRRTALLLRWKDQLPYEEIGRVLGVSAVAAQRLVMRARAAVKLKIAPLMQP
jgi:RNA polymerase sigma-70 factor (ECF subfamily)